MISLAGSPFVLGPLAALTDDERASLQPFEGEFDSARAPFRIDVVDTPPWTSDDADLFGMGVPVRLVWSGDRLRVSHDVVTAELDPFTRTGQLYRPQPEPFALHVVLRAALSVALPLDGGLLLHSAGIVIDGRAFLFFGPSGAGKSTLSALAGEHPVLSDELVALTAVPRPRASATGFWGTLDRDDAPRGEFPIAALIELHKGREFALERVAPHAALRKLLGVTVVPPAPPVWNAALGVLGRLASAVPVMTMTWSPSDPPFDRLRALPSEGLDASRNPLV